MAKLILVSPWAMLIPFGMSMSSPVSALPDPGVQCEGVYSDGFDWPIGGPNADGYYAVRRFGEKTHLGEDWVPMAGDAQQEVRSVSHGVVVHQEESTSALGNVVVVRHCLRGPGGALELIDSLYGQLSGVHVQLGEHVERGQKIGLLGDGRASVTLLHLEIRDVGVEIGTGFGDPDQHRDPSRFIGARRPARSWLAL